jgi:molybdopterin-guanine dinucleotide biosynthesis protein A
MPRILPATYSRLLASCSAKIDFVGWKSPSGPEPLCSVWSVRLLAAVEQARAAGEARPMAALSRSQGALWLELSGTGAAQTMNINTPEDLQRLQRPHA